MVADERLAAERLDFVIFHPPNADLFVGEAFHVFQEVRAGYLAGRPILSQESGPKASSKRFQSISPPRRTNS